MVIPKRRPSSTVMTELFMGRFGVVCEQLETRSRGPKVDSKPVVHGFRMQKSRSRPSPDKASTKLSAVRYEIRVLSCEI